ncbi:MAG: dienelactone hydrolase family protein [Clostridia bacterium]|nr:dienelactone hydrolase family protein [Clostridia bacterium]
MNNEFIFTRPVEVAGSLSGIVTVPTGFDQAKESLPVIVFLHGAGERGDGSAQSVQKVKVHGIPKIFAANPDYHDLRVITLSPQCPCGMTWNHLAFPLMQWIKVAVAELNGDESRISITGLSMGGFGSWEMLLTFPAYFSCGAPICGGGLSWRADALRGKKLRVFHGLDDRTVPFSYSEQMVDAARANGADVTFTAYDQVGHNSWTRAYEETDLIDWLVSNRLGE